MVKRAKQQFLRTVWNHPLAPPSGAVAVSRLNLYEKIGPGKHPCHWCGEPVEWMPGRGLVKGALLADHVNWDRNDDRPQNLVPSCNHCNSTRTKDGSRHRIADDELSVVWGGLRTRAVQRQCEFCGEDFLTIPAEVKIGKGRFCSRECGYANRSRKGSR